MTVGEQLYLGLVVAAFSIFGVALAIIASSTERFLRRKTNAARQDALKKAA
jgi:hypothetical protein